MFQEGGLGALHNFASQGKKKKKKKRSEFGCLPFLLASQAALAPQVHQVAPEKKDTEKSKHQHQVIYSNIINVVTLFSLIAVR